MERREGRGMGLRMMMMMMTIMIMITVMVAWALGIWEIMRRSDRESGNRIG